MSLAENIRDLRHRTLASLAATHDYYVDSTIAWQVTRLVVKRGQPFNYRNVTTGTHTTAAELVLRSELYVSQRLRQATFQHFISLFEGFLFDLLRLWLSVHPQSLFRKTIDFKSIWEAPDKEAVTLLFVNKEINELMYQRPADWFAYLNDKVNLGCPTPEQIDCITEAKATRDLVIHAGNVVNKIYLAKAGQLARAALGEFLDLPEDYPHHVWATLCQVTDDVGAAALAKAA